MSPETVKKDEGVRVGSARHLSCEVEVRAHPHPLFSPSTASVDLSSPLTHPCLHSDHPNLVLLLRISVHWLRSSRVMLPLRPLQFGGVVLVALSTLFLLSTWWSSSSTSQPQHHSLTSPDLQAPEILAPGTPRPTAHTGRRRVAVIGAGASGSAAAFFLDRAAKEANAHVDVVVYEKNDYIGGSEYSGRVGVRLRAAVDELSLVEGRARADRPRSSFSQGARPSIHTVTSPSRPSSWEPASL